MRVVKSRCLLSFAGWRRPICGQHNVGCDREPKRVLTHKRNMDKYGNYCEPHHNERNHVYAENVEHRSCILPGSAVNE